MNYLRHNTFQKQGFLYDTNMQSNDGFLLFQLAYLIVLKWVVLPIPSGPKYLRFYCGKKKKLIKISQE